MTTAALAALHCAAFENNRAWSDAEFTALLSQPGSLLSACEDGFALGRVTLDEAEVLTIATHPDVRRHGTARKHLNALEAMARDKGARRIFLEVDAANIPAISLYLGAGYHESGQRPGYYRATDGTRTDALILSKPLT